MTTLREAMDQIRAGTVLRVGDVIQCYRPGDFEMLRGPSADGGPWPATGFPLGFRFGGDHVSLASDDPFETDVPADFAERAALEGRVVYPADPWSTWTEDGR